MYARVVTAHIQPHRLDEVIQVFRDSIWPAGKQQKGHKGGYLLTDRKTGKAISVALWETEADMTAGETSNYLREQIAKVASAFTAAPVTEHYEVSVE
jgi:heme-degrading monooxygenase HmoA